MSCVARCLGIDYRVDRRANSAPLIGGMVEHMDLRTLTSESFDHDLHMVHCQFRELMQASNPIVPHGEDVDAARLELADR